MHGSGNICDCGNFHKIGHSGDNSVFLYIKGPRIQGKRAAEHRNTICWKNPFQELSERERNEYGEERGDNYIGGYMKLNMVTKNDVVGMTYILK